MITRGTSEIEIVVGGRSLTVEAAVADKLPMSVLLGRDVPELGVLLQKSDQDIGEMQPGDAARRGNDCHNQSTEETAATGGSCPDGGGEERWSQSQGD